MLTESLGWCTFNFCWNSFNIHCRSFHWKVQQKSCTCQATFQKSRLKTERHALCWMTSSRQVALLNLFAKKIFSFQRLQSKKAAPPLVQTKQEHKDGRRANEATSQNCLSASEDLWGHRSRKALDKKDAKNRLLINTNAALRVSRKAQRRTFICSLEMLTRDSLDFLFRALWELQRCSVSCRKGRFRFKKLRRQRRTCTDSRCDKQCAVNAWVLSKLHDTDAIQSNGDRYNQLKPEILSGARLLLSNHDRLWETVRVQCYSMTGRSAKRLLRLSYLTRRAIPTRIKMLRSGCKHAPVWTAFSLRNSQATNGEENEHESQNQGATRGFYFRVKTPGSCRTAYLEFNSLSIAAGWLKPNTVVRRCHLMSHPGPDFVIDIRSLTQSMDAKDESEQKASDVLSW